MPRPSIDLTGLKFSRWTVLEKDVCAPNGSGNEAKWICLCECGTQRSVGGSRLRTGESKSCGCFAKEVATKHGMRFSREYQSWVSLRARVKPNYQEKHLYFDRGIDVDPRWDESFEAFIEDMGLMPEGKYSIDRINNDLGYWKHNCRWATDLQQGQNRRCVIKIEYEGRNLSLKQWSKETGIHVGALKSRYDSGWSTHDLLNTPSDRRPKVKRADLQMNGKSQGLSEWSAEIGIPYSILAKRVKRGWTDEQVLTTPIGSYVKPRGKASNT